MKRSLLALSLVLATMKLAAQGPPPGPHGPGPGPEDWARSFFTPELVMQHQSEIGLQEAQRATLTTAVQQAQAKLTEVQWKLSAEGEKLSRLFQSTQVSEPQVLEQVDRILNLERDVKKAQISLMVRIKNTLTATQQAKLTEIRDRKE